MNDKNGFMLSNRDRVLRGWQASTQLVREYQDYAHEMEEDEKLSKLFAHMAEDEAEHAAKLLVLLQGYDKQRV